MGRAGLETNMTSMEIKALEDTGPNRSLWLDAYDDQPRYAQLVVALLPATLILFAATALLLALL